MYPAVQIVPIPETVQNIPGRRSKATNEIVFRATDIPAFGMKLYLVGKKKQEDISESELESEFESESEPEPVNFINTEVNKFI